MSKMSDVLKAASSAAPIAVINGRKVYSGEDAQTRNKADLMEEKAMGTSYLGSRAVNPDGTFAASRANNVAIDPAMFFDNRYRKVGDAYEVVTDYRAIKEQSTGRVYTDNIAVNVIHKDKGKIALKEVKTISAAEFVKDFKQKLDTNSIVSIHNLLSGKVDDMREDKLEL